MKLLASAATSACVLAVLAVVAPALSFSPWRPDPVDFELAPGPGAELPRDGGLVSRPISPARHFNLVGLRWSGSGEPGVTLRVRRVGERWTRWTRVPVHADHAPDGGRGEHANAASDPVWVGEADQVQYRLTRRLPGLRLHFVNVKGSASAADRARTALRRVASTATVAVGRLFGAGAARAASQPAIVPRSGWGAEDCPPRKAPDYGTVKAAYVHHTVSLNDYTPEEAPGIVLAICRYHRNSNGWNDIGYNFLADKYGTLYEGRAGGIDQAVVGAQAQGYNAQTTGIASIGDNRSFPAPTAELEAIARLIRWKLPLHGAPTAGWTTLISAGGETNRYPAGTHVRVHRVLGHRDTGSTACPGDALYSQLPSLRRMVGTVAPAGVATALLARVAPRMVRYGRTARIDGSLMTADAAPLAGEAVQVQVFRKRSWHTVEVVTTDGTGAFEAPLVARRTRDLRARFAGRDGLLASSSPRITLPVRPQLRLIGVPALGSAREQVRFRGSVAPRKRLVWQVLQVRRRGRWTRAGVRTLRVRSGRFRGGFVPARRGSYRVYVVARADRATARGRSAVAALEVD